MHSFAIRHVSFLTAIYLPVAALAAQDLSTALGDHVAHHAADWHTKSIDQALKEWPRHNTDLENTTFLVDYSRWNNFKDPDDDDKPQDKDPKNKDPMGGLMDLMGKVYHDGDDEMKRMIAEHWHKSRESRDRKEGKPIPPGPQKMSSLRRKGSMQGMDLPELPDDVDYPPRDPGAPTSPPSEFLGHVKKGFMKPADDAAPPANRGEPSKVKQIEAAIAATRAAGVQGVALEALEKELADAKAADVAQKAAQDPQLLLPDTRQSLSTYVVALMVGFFLGSSASWLSALLLCRGGSQAMCQRPLLAVTI